MNIVILGAGALGAYVASTLSKEEHNVILIDQNSKTFKTVSCVAITGILFLWQ